MQKLLDRCWNLFLVMILLVSSTGAFAQAVLDIVPSLTTANLNLTGISTVTFTVTNNTKHPIDQLTFDPTNETTGNPRGINLINNNCFGVTLTPNEKCNFQTILTGGVDNPSVFSLRPKVCGYNGAVCSIPIASNIVRVTTSPRSAFITNFNNSTLSVCQTNADGALSNCTVFQDPSFNGPAGVTLNSAGIYLDIANYNDNSVSICPINANGILGTCTREVDPTFNGPNSIKSNLITDYVYVTNYNNNTVSICPITSPGVFSNCTAVSSPSFSGPNTIALNTIGTFAYITNNFNDTVSVCPINSTGMFGTCVASNPGATFHGPTGIIINQQGTFAYVSNSTNVGGNRSVSVCSINSDGSLGICTPYISSLFNGDNFGKVAINSASTFLYVVNQSNNYVTLCSLNSDGSIGTCSQLSPGTLDSPQGINVG
jgi:6-phosphogluconolactonase (cycloisomerase 2 family)